MLALPKAILLPQPSFSHLVRHQKKNDETEALYLPQLPARRARSNLQAWLIFGNAGSRKNWAAETSVP